MNNDTDIDTDIDTELDDIEIEPEPEPNEPTITCDNCHKSFPEDDLSYQMSDPANQVWCESCFADDGCVCEDCDKSVDADKTYQVYKQSRHTYGNIELTVCSDCFDNYNKCDKCNNYYLNLTSHAGYDVCNSCYEENCYVCEDCEEEYWGGDWHDCQSSDSNSDYIHSYDFDVTNNLPFLGTPADKLWLGVELEVEVSRYNDRADIADTIGYAMTDFAILKSDSSLNNGFEIVTAPATLEIHREQWNKRFYGKPWLSQLSSWNAGTCGLHVHVSRAAISKLTQAKMVLFCNLVENRSWLIKLAGRESEDYAKFKNITKRGACLRCYGRYEVLNVSNYDTLEFRLFKGSLKPERLWRALEFSHSLVKFCQQASLEKLLIADYVKWLEDKRKRYPAMGDWCFGKVEPMGELGKLGMKTKTLPLYATHDAENYVESVSLPPAV